MNEYKMRAECLDDVLAALAEFHALRMLGDVKIERLSVIFGEVCVTFTHKGNLAWVRRDLAKVRDGHCMVRTVALADDYTGTQYFDEADSF